MNPVPVTAAGRKAWKVGGLTYTSGSLALLFTWLLWGDFAWGMRDRAIPPIMQLLFKHYGASDVLTGLLLSSLPAAFGMVLGPWTGYWSDRFRGPRGRRIPFLIVPVPIIVLALAGLSMGPWLGGLLDRQLGAHSPGTLACVLIALGLFWTVFELGCATTNGIYGGLINDVVPQSIVGRFFGLFRACGLLAGIAFTFWLLGNADVIYPWIFLGVALLYGIGFLTMCLKVKEGKYPPPPGPGPNSRQRLAALKTYVRDTFGHPYYRGMFIATILAGLSFTPFNLYSVIYAQKAGLGLPAYGHCLAATYAVSLCLAYPLGVLADRFHPLRVSFVCLALYALVMLAGCLWVHDAFSFSVILIAHGVGVGSYATASCSLGQRLLPRARFAEIGSAGGILNNLAAIILAPTVGFILDCTQHAYHELFYMGLVLALAGLAGFVHLVRNFYALGGPDAYVAPA